MGFWEAIFGGTETKQHDVTPYLNELKDQYVDKLPGWARFYKHAVKDFQNPELDYTQIRGFGPQNAAIDAEASGAYRDAERQIQSQTAFENQPFLNAAMLSQMRGQLGESTAEAKSRALADFRREATGGWAEGTKWVADQNFRVANARLSGYLASFYQKQRNGILPALSQAAASAGSLMTGAGAVGFKV